MTDVAINIAGLTLATDQTADDLKQRHRRERKEHQSKVQALKKSADKKNKREVLQQIADLDAALERRHEAEQQQFDSVQTADTANNTATTEANANHVADSQTNTAALNAFITPTGDDNQRVSKAQKRRDKKAAADRQLLVDIAAQEELNKTGARTLETTAIRKLLHARGLQPHTVPSDGDCLYNAVAHQLAATGRQPPHGVAALRTLAADYIEANRDELIVYMTNPRTGDCLDDVEFGAYCEAVRASSTWGGQLEIKALSNALRVPIEVLQASGPPTVQNEGDFGGEPLVMTYHRHMYSLGEHYNGTRRMAAANGGGGDNSSDEGQPSK